MSVLAAASLHHINSTDWKRSRQAAPLTVYWEAHWFLHGNTLEVKCDHICPVPRAAAFRQNGLSIIVDNSLGAGASRDTLRHATNHAISNGLGHERPA